MAELKADGAGEKRFAESLWLNYFNRFLYDDGTISEAEYKKMVEKIARFCDGRPRGGSV